MEPFIGQIILFGGNFAPRGWELCHGQLIAISQNSALFSILGTTYGGDGVSTFALPDLRGRVPISSGSGPGLTQHTLGQTGGAESHTLLANQVPSHTHSLMASSAAGTQPSPAGASLGSYGQTAPPSGPYSSESPTVPMSAGSIGPNGGGGMPVEIVQPYLALNFIIATVGLYPSRS